MIKKEIFICDNCGKKFLDYDKQFFYDVMTACSRCYNLIAEVDKQIEKEYNKRGVK